MPYVTANGVRLYYEAAGESDPVVFAHEFSGDLRSWHAQMRFLEARHRVVAYNARGYPPSDVPDDPEAYSQDIAVEDLRILMDDLDLSPACLCGMSMGAFSVLHLALRYPRMVRAVVVVACGYGADDPVGFRSDSERLARDIDEQGMGPVAYAYADRARSQLKAKNAGAWREFADALAAHSARGAACTMRCVQARRPTIYELGPALANLVVPTLIVTGDEDTGCLNPALFMKQHIASAGLLVLPNTGHTVNLEEPEAFNRAIAEFLALVEAGRWPVRWAQRGNNG